MKNVISAGSSVDVPACEFVYPADYASMCICTRCLVLDVIVCALVCTCIYLYPFADSSLRGVTCVSYLL